MIRKKRKKLTKTSEKWEIFSLRHTSYENNLSKQQLIKELNNKETQRTNMLISLFGHRLNEQECLDLLPVLERRKLRSLSRIITEKVKKKTRKVIMVLRRLCDDENPNIRAFAYYDLGKYAVKDQAILKFLMNSFLTESDKNAQIMIINALKRIALQAEEETMEQIADLLTVRTNNELMAVQITALYEIALARESIFVKDCIMEFYSENWQIAQIARIMIKKL